MLVGYARGATVQEIEAQTTRLAACGAERIFADLTADERGRDRRQRAKLLEFLRPGDKVLVTAVDRVDQDIEGLIAFSDCLTRADVAFAALDDGIDTTDTRQHFLQILGFLSRFVRRYPAAPRVRAKPESRRNETAGAPARIGSRGRRGMVPAELWMSIKTRLAAGEPLQSVAADTGVSRQTIWYRLGRDISPTDWAIYQARLAAGEDRRQVISDMNLFPMAVERMEAAASRSAVLQSIRQATRS